MLIVQPRHIGGFVEGVLGAAEGGRALLAISQAADTHDAFGWRQAVGGFLSAPGAAFEMVKIQKTHSHTCASWLVTSC